MSRRDAMGAIGGVAGTLLLGACDVWPAIVRDETSAGGSPLSIDALRRRAFPPSEIRLHSVIEKNDEYTQYLMTHDSDGLRVTGVAALPHGAGPFPVVVLNHGYIFPARYETGDGTRAISDALARRGLIALASDYRGLGGSDDDVLLNIGIRFEFTVDVLNLVAGLASIPEARTDRVGMWGHSLGSNVSLRAAEVNSLVGPIALWAPMSAWIDDVASYYLLPTSDESEDLRGALSPGNYLQHLRGPVAIHQGEADRVVLPAWARRLHTELLAAGVESELRTYPGLGHYLNLEAQAVVRQTADFFTGHLQAPEEERAAG